MPCFSPPASLAGGAPAVWVEAPDNVLVDTHFGDEEATDRAFTEADHVVAMEFHIGRVTGVPIEPRAALGHYDAETGRYTLWAGSGGAVRQKAELAAVLGVAPERVRVVSQDVGGNFGTRNRLYVESALMLVASRRIGRPVKYTSTRSEVFLTDFQGRDLLTKVELALAGDGRFLGLRADNVSNVGALRSSLAARQGLGPRYRQLRYSGGEPAVARRLHQHDADQRLSQSGRPEVTHAMSRGQPGG